MCSWLSLASWCFMWRMKRRIEIAQLNVLVSLGKLCFTKVIACYMFSLWILHNQVRWMLDFKPITSLFGLFTVSPLLSTSCSVVIFSRSSHYCAVCLFIVIIAFSLCCMCFNCYFHFHHSFIFNFICSMLTLTLIVWLIVSLIDFLIDWFFNLLII